MIKYSKIFVKTLGVIVTSSHIFFGVLNETEVTHGQPIVALLDFLLNVY